MKQKDIALILVIGFFALILGVVTSNLLFNNESSQKLKAPKVTAIKSDFTRPDKKYFNAESIDPTQIIRIGENANQTPFNQ